MRILFYMPVVYGSIEDRIAWVKSKKMRGELIYNIVDTEKLGCEVLASPTKCYGIADKRLYIYNTFKFLCLLAKYEIIYTPYFQGIEWLIYLRA